MFWLLPLACDPTPSETDTGVPIPTACTGPLVLEPFPLRHGDVPVCTDHGEVCPVDWTVGDRRTSAAITPDGPLWPGDHVQCAALGSTETASATVEPGNLLVIVSDDQGVDWMGAYGEGSARTPTLDQLASDGLLFRRAYSQPVCSPARAASIAALRASRLV